MSWDAHKWLMQTYGCSMVLLRDRSKLLQSFSTIRNICATLKPPTTIPISGIWAQS